MPREFSRNRRVGQLLKRELAVLLQRDFPTPKGVMVTVSAVDVSPDLRNAKVYITVLGSGNIEDILNRLGSDSGKIRYALAQRVKLRVIPKLDFVHDFSLEQGNRMDALLKFISAKE